MLYIGVTTRDRCAHSQQSIATIVTRTVTPFRLVIADDFSSDRTIDGVRGLCEKIADKKVELAPYLAGIEIMPSPVRLGVARNKNRIINYALSNPECSSIILIEDDVYVMREGWDRVLLETSAESKQAHLCYMPKDIRGGEPFGYQARVEGSPGHVIQWKPLLSGMCMFFTAKLLREIGGFDEGWASPYGYEHNELSARAMAAQGIQPNYFPHPFSLEEGKYLDCDDMNRVPMWNAEQHRERHAKTKLNENRYNELMAKHMKSWSEPGRELHF